MDSVTLLSPYNELTYTAEIMYGFNSIIFFGLLFYYIGKLTNYYYKFHETIQIYCAESIEMENNHDLSNKDFIKNYIKLDKTIAYYKTSFRMFGVEISYATIFKSLAVFAIAKIVDYAATQL